MKILVLSAFLFLISCTTTGDEQARAFVQGNVITNLSTDLVELQLKSENVIISKILLKGSKNFTLSGPLLGKTFFLVSNRKIKSITGSRSSNLKITADSLSVEFTAGLTYSDNLELKLTK